MIKISSLYVECITVTPKKFESKRNSKHFDLFVVVTAHISRYVRVNLVLTSFISGVTAHISRYICSYKCILS